MCASCFTSIDALAMGATGLTAVASTGLRRARDLLAGRPAADRRREARDSNSAFLLSLGLDPGRLLGGEAAVADCGDQVAAAIGSSGG